MATVRLTIHVDDETNIKADRVPSASTDFVSVSTGNQASILLFNTAQAKALGEAVAEAYNLLRQIELEKVEIAPMFSKPWESVRMDGYDVVRCTISNPCEDCRNLDEPDYPDWDGEF